MSLKKDLQNKNSLFYTMNDQLLFSIDLLQYFFRSLSEKYEGNEVSSIPPKLDNFLKFSPDDFKDLSQEVLKEIELIQKITVKCSTDEKKPNQKEIKKCSNDKKESIQRKIENGSNDQDEKINTKELTDSLKRISILSLKIREHYLEKYSGEDKFTIDSWKENFNKLYFTNLCFYQNNPFFVHCFPTKYDIDFEELERFMNTSAKYEQELSKRIWNFIEIVDYLCKDKNLKPFFVLYYDKSPKAVTEGPWITQVIFTMDQFNFFIRISYHDYKFGLYRYYPYEESNDGKIRFYRKRINEVYKYSNRLIIPSMSSPNHWRNKIIDEELIKQAHHKLIPMRKKTIGYYIAHMKRTGYMDPRKGIFYDQREKNEEINDPSIFENITMENVKEETNEDNMEVIGDIDSCDKSSDNQSTDESERELKKEFSEDIKKNAKKSFKNQPFDVQRSYGHRNIIDVY